MPGDFGNDATRTQASVQVTRRLSGRRKPPGLAPDALPQEERTVREEEKTGCCALRWGCPDV